MPLQLMHVERTPSGFAVARAGYERMSEWDRRGDLGRRHKLDAATREEPGHADRASLRAD